jgi:alpha-1,3-mannosyltransferase
MKILHVTRQYFPQVGGIENVIWNLAKRQISAGHTVQIGCLNRPFQRAGKVLPAQETYEGALIHRLPFWGPRQYAMAPGVLSLTRGCDVIHLHSCDFFLDFLALTRPLHRKPIVLSAHGFYFHSSNAGILKRLYFQSITRMAMRAIDAIVCASDQDMALARRIAPRSKVFHIPYGVDYEPLARFPIPGRDPNALICVERLADNKRQNLLLDCISQILPIRPEIRLTIIGPDAGMRSTLEAQIRKMHLEGNVELAGGMTWNAMTDRLRRAAVWISATKYESFGLALLEAMAAGCLPVVQHIPAFRELISPGENGWLTDFTSPEQAARDILRALTADDATRANMAAAARLTASRFTWQVAATEIETLYHSTASAGS